MTNPENENPEMPVTPVAEPAPAVASTPAYITYDDYKKVEIKIGRILSVQPVEKSERLLLLSVDFGEEKPRTVVSGIAKYFPDPSVLVNVTCPFVTNLEPRPLMGHTSEAMILAASTEAGEFSILRAEGIPPGTGVK